MVLHKVLEEAVEQRSKDRSMFLQNLETAVHNAVVKAFK